MEELILITDLEAVGQESTEEIKETREASRAVLFDENNLVPILYVAKKDFHKLPGGGIENGEDKIEALHRECLEELGCEIEVICEIGKTEETRKNHHLHIINYCYFGKITKKTGVLNFDSDEINDGYEVKWVEFDEALRLIKNDKPQNYNAKFIRLRELVVLEKAKEILANDKELN